MKHYLYLMRLHKPIGILLLLWPTLWALWLASDGKPDWFIVFIFIMGVVVMRSAGCIINDFADKDFDSKVERTRTRPLTNENISEKSALILFGCLMIIAFILVCTLNRLTIFLSFAGAFFAMVYPFLKRVTHLPQVGLGIAFAWSVPMAFSAELNQVPSHAWAVFIAALIWPVIYDTYYAMVDRPDDLKIGIKSTAILFGDRDRLFIAILQILFLFLMGIVGVIFELQFIYFISLLISGLLFLYHQWLTRYRDPQACFSVFLSNQWVGFIIFLGILFSMAIKNRGIIF